MAHAILPAYRKLLEEAVSKKKENKLFVQHLKKLKPKNLDALTNRFHDEAFEHIDCLKCGNCCATTGPLLKHKDITKLSATLKMKAALFSETFIRKDDDGDWVFNKLPCPFLNDDNHCSVYASRPGACRDYPHTQQRNIIEKLPITFLNSMICPAVAVVLEKLKSHFGH